MPVFLISAFQSDNGRRTPVGSKSYAAATGQAAITAARADSYWANFHGTKDFIAEELPEVASGTTHVYDDGGGVGTTVLTTAFAAHHIAPTSIIKSLSIVNDDTAASLIELSWNGTTVALRVKNGEFFSFSRLYFPNGVYIRGAAGGEKYRLTVLT